MAFFTVMLTVLAHPDVKSVPATNYPVKFAYINLLSTWSSATGIANSLGVPGYSTHNFNYIALTFYLCGSGPADTAILWNDPVTYMGATAEFGSTNS